MSRILEAINELCSSEPIESIIDFFTSKPFLAIIGLLSLVGFITTVIAQRQQNKRFDDIIESLDAVAKSLSTRYVDQFPQYLSNVPELLRKAEKNIRVVSIVPTPGVFSGADHWHDIKAILARASRRTDMKVEAVFGNRDTSECYLKEQFQTEGTIWSEWSKVPKNREKLVAFFRDYNSEIDVLNCSHDDFLKTFENASKIELAASLHLVQKKFLTYRPQICMWIIDDDKEAIFMMQTAQRHLNSHAFWTRDPKLIGGLNALYSELWPR
jgi:hypothetical protein